MARQVGRSGSAGNDASPVPHTRIEDEAMLEEMYIFGQKLGQGTFGVVREVVHKQTKQRWACKAINKEKAGTSAMKLMEREVQILKKVRHDHIIGLREVLESPKKMYLIMELCEDGELADVLSEKNFSEKDTKTIMSRVASAISYLHKNDMVHRDLKLENILLSKNHEDRTDNLFIKVTDFGLSVVKGGSGHDNMLMDFCGTPMYMSPEIIENKTYSEKCDVWAMGVIMYNLLCGSPPFVSKDEEHLYEIIKSAELDFETDPIWENISKEAKDCIQGMLRVDTAHRLSASEILMHPWIMGTTMETSQAPKNVLEMMKDFAEETKQKEASEEMNGGGSLVVEDDSLSDSGSRSGSASSRRSATNSGGTSRRSPGQINSTPRKGNSNNSKGNNNNSVKSPATTSSTPKGLPRNNSFPSNPSSLANKSGKSRSPVSGTPSSKPGHSGATSRPTQSQKTTTRAAATPPTGKTKRK